MTRLLPAALSRLLERVDGRVARLSTFRLLAAKAAGYDRARQRHAEEAVRTERALGEPSAEPDATVGDRAGVCGAHEQMIAERDGYRGAYEMLQKELGETRAELYNMKMERDGFKRAYEVVLQGPQWESDSDISPPSPDSASPPLPGIAVLSLPKSGTVYINGLLTSGLGLPAYPISLGYFPSDTVDLRRMRKLARGGLVASAHSDPSPVNRCALAAYAGRWVVHLRDPRSVTLSWTHHTEHHAGNIDRALSDQSLGRGYFDLPFDAKLDVMIERFLPHTVSWTSDWLRAVDSGEYQVLVTTFDELLLDERALIDRILAFYGIPIDLYKPPQLARSVESSNFRAGRPDEWRSVFTSRQLDRANEIIGRELLQRFDWPQS